MLTLGITFPRTADGLELDDGAAVLVQDGRPLVAVAEERVTRQKYRGGFVNAMDYCLAAVDAVVDDVDTIAVSTCCEELQDHEQAREALRSSGIAVRSQRVDVVPHHLSHAASAFLPSGSSSALVVVADNMGTMIGPRVSPRAWENAFERTSVFAARLTDGVPRLDLVSRHGDQHGEISLGSVYHYFTKWLGFGSYHESGKTMALSAFGGDRFAGIKLFDWSDGRLVSRLAPSHTAKAEAVRKFLLRETGEDIGPGRAADEPFTDVHFDVARLVQKELERALQKIVRSAARTADGGTEDLCLAGGVALNCVANSVLAEAMRPKRMFVQPAASDVGQALGNALWAQAREGVMCEQLTTDALGRAYGDADVQAAAGLAGPDVRLERVAEPAVVGAQLIASGKVIGWFQGRSEFGPRALGHRSILGDPRRGETKLLLDHSIKRREWFRPYAPAVLFEHLSEVFDLRDEEVTAGYNPLAMMLMAPQVRERWRSRIPAVVHVDGSARGQLVDGGCQPFYSLVREFHRLTGVPLVLNTSFNPAGDPIVESPSDALAALRSMGLDAVIVESFLATTP